MDDDQKQSINSVFGRWVAKLQGNNYHQLQSTTINRSPIYQPTTAARYSFWSGDSGRSCTAIRRLEPTEGPRRSKDLHRKLEMNISHVDDGARSPAFLGSSTGHWLCHFGGQIKTRQNNFTNDLRLQMMKHFNFQGRKQLINVDHHLMSPVRQEHPGIKTYCIVCLKLDDRTGLPAPPRSFFLSGFVLTGAKVVMILPS